LQKAHTVSLVLRDSQMHSGCERGVAIKTSVNSSVNWPCRQERLKWSGNRWQKNTCQVEPGGERCYQSKEISLQILALHLLMWLAPLATN